MRSRGWLLVHLACCGYLGPRARRAALRYVARSIDRAEAQAAEMLEPTSPSPVCPDYVEQATLGDGRPRWQVGTTETWRRDEPVRWSDEHPEVRP